MDAFSLHILTTSWPLSPPSAGAAFLLGRAGRAASLIGGGPPLRSVALPWRASQPRSPSGNGRSGATARREWPTEARREQRLVLLVHGLHAAVEELDRADGGARSHGFASSAASPSAPLSASRIVTIVLEADTRFTSCSTPKPDCSKTSRCRPTTAQSLAAGGAMVSVPMASGGDAFVAEGWRPPGGSQRSATDFRAIVVNESL